MRVLPEVDLSKLPNDVRAAIAQLELELSEGDITEKGYEKKRRLLLGPYIQAQLNKGCSGNQETIGRTNRRQSQRLTRNESRYHSEIRVEAVQQALADWNRAGITKTTAFNVQTPINSDGSCCDKRSNMPSTDTSTSLAAIQPNRRQRTASIQATAPTNSSSEDEDNNEPNCIDHDDANVKNKLTAASGTDSAKRCNGTVEQYACENNLKPSCSAQIDVTNTPESTSKKDRMSVILPTSNASENELDKVPCDYENLRDDPITSQDSTVNASKNELDRTKSAQNVAEAYKTSESPSIFATTATNSPNSTKTECGMPMQMRRPADRSMRRASPMVQRTSVLVLEDRPLPELPADASDLSDQDEGGAPFSTRRAIADSLESGGDAAAAYINTRTSTNDSGLGGSSKAPQDYANANFPLKPVKVSQKIQQLLLTLQRPKKKALQEYYNDDDAELEAIAKTVDRNAPKPTGSLITPVRGDFTSLSNRNAPQPPRTIDSMLQRHGTTKPKAIAGVVLDVFGKSSITLTYGKLLSRATKIAYTLLTKQVTLVSSGTKEKVHLCLPGDRVALVYPNTEPLSFLATFYGCLLAGVVPVPIEVPLTKRDAGIQQFGFLLGSCGVRVALTSESCLKGLPKVGSQPSGSSQSGASNISASSAPMITPSSPHTGTTLSGGGGGGSFGSFHHHQSNGSFPSSTTGSGGSTGAGGSSTGANHYNHFAPSTNANDVAEFKCWPRLHWTVTENLSKPPKDWTLPSLLVNNDCAYIEYTTDREGGIKGVCVSRQAMINHCRAIVATMGYKEGDTIVSVLDFKRDVGFWHGILAAIYIGMKIHFVPYLLMKINPISWLSQITKFQANFVLARSRDLHWSLMAYEATRRDAHQNAQFKEPPLNLESLTAIVVADGFNPWSLSSCDQFLETFRSIGLNPEVICPCAGSPETGTVALRRPLNFMLLNSNGNGISEQNGNNSTPRSGRGILSMLALSHLVVRVDHENSLMSLTLQDAGNVIPGGMAIVVKSSGAPKLCRADEIGEICLHAPSTASCYFGLKGVSQQTFAVSPLDPNDRPLGPANYVRSGLIGFLGPNGLVFIIGNKTAQLYVSGRQHSADDLIATVLAVEPMKFVYRGRIAVFSVPVLRDERICVVAEQKPDVSEEEAFNWMVRVLHAVDSIHQVGIYCLGLLSPNQLPKTQLGGIHVSETRRRFLDGCLHPTTVLMCPQNCVLNLPKPREPHSHEVGPAAMFVGNIVQGARIASAQGRELIVASDETIYFIDILRQRSIQTPDHLLYTLVNAKGTEVDTLSCQQLLKRSERIGALLLDKGRLAPGDHVALIFPPGLEFITAFYGCLSVGLVPVCIRPPSSINLQASLITVRMIVDVSKSVALLSNSSLIKLLKSKEASSHRLNTKAWPTILDIDDAPSSSVARRQKIGNAVPALDFTRRSNDACYLDFSVSTTGQLTGVVVTASGAMTQCKSLKVACELYPSRDMALCLDPYSGLGFTMWCLSSVYAGHHSTLISPTELEHNATTWLSTISQNKVRDTFCSYSVMEMCVRELAPQIQLLKEKGLNLSCLRSCVVVAEERPRVQLCNAFVKMLAPLGLSARSVSTSFGARVNAAICMQGASSPDPSTLYVDVRALRNDRVTLVEKGAPHSIPLMESGKLLPGVKVVIANPETKGQCADSHLGEIWVAGSHNAAGYFSIFGDDTHLHTDHFTARLKTGDTKTIFARTGYLGFLHQTQSITAEGELHDAVFVVGSLDETLMLRGMRYHPADIEMTVARSHKRICESAVFTWTHLLVVVAETDAPESDALDLVPAITSAVLEEQHLIVGVVMITDPATIPINSRGEKQRLHLRDAFLKDQLDPIYVAYNM